MMLIMVISVLITLMTMIMMISYERDGNNDNYDNGHERDHDNGNQDDDDEDSDGDDCLFRYEAVILLPHSTVFLCCRSILCGNVTAVTCATTRVTLIGTHFVDFSDYLEVHSNVICSMTSIMTFEWAEIRIR